MTTLARRPSQRVARRRNLALAVIIPLMLTACGDEDKVRACLKDNQYSGGMDHVYLDEVVSVKVFTSYPDGRATRFVKYRVRGSDEIRSTTCLW